MPVKLTIFLIFFCLIFMFFVYRLILKGKILIKYALPWLGFPIVMLVAALIPNFIQKVANLIGIEVASNFVFLLEFIILLFICFILTSIVSHQKMEIVSLVQELSILKKRVGDLENEKIKESNK